MDWKEIANTFDVYSREFGGVPYITCPGAGVYEPVSSHQCYDPDPTESSQSVNNFWNDRDETTYQILRINLEHPVKMSRLAIRAMARANSLGIIVLLSSIGAQGVSIVTPLYGISKQGVSHFVRSMAGLEDLLGIRVVAVAPGPTKTPMMSEKSASRFSDPVNDKFAEPSGMADAMATVCFDKKYPAGTVLEATHPGKLREVFLLNDPGPDPSAWVSKKVDALADIKDAILADQEDRKP